MSFINVDNANPSLRYYPSADAAWFFISATGDGAVFDSTLSRIEGVGAVSFQFNGTQIRVTGTIFPPVNSSGPPVSSYTIDGGIPVVYIAPVPTDEADGVTFFISDDMPFGQHELMINVTDASSASPFLLDYLSYSTASAPSPSTSQSASGSASSNTGSTSSAPTSGSTSGSASGSTSSGNSSNHVGAIVGGVVGGLVGLVAVALFFFFWNRCRRVREYRYTHARKETATELLAEEGTVPTPFVLTSQTGYTGSMSQAHESGMVSDTAPSDSQLIYRGPQPAGMHYGGEVPSDSMGQLGSSTGTGRGPGKGAPPAAPLTQHADSGVRFGEHITPSEIVESTDIPPLYTPD